MKEVTVAEAKARCARPERICLAVTADGDGTPNIMPLGWKMWTSGDPAMVAISIGHSRYSHELIQKSGEFVLAWPGEDMSEGVLTCGGKSGKDVNKLQETGWSVLPATKIKVPLIQECIANLECKVTDSLDTGDHTIFAAEIVASHIGEDDRRLLIAIGLESGYETLGGRGGYLFGAVKR